MKSFGSRLFNCAKVFKASEDIFDFTIYIYKKKITTWKREKYHKKPQPTELRRQENETKPGRMCLVSSTEIFYKHYAMNLLKILSFREKIKKKEKQHEGGGKSSKQKNPCRTMNGCFAGGWWERKTAAQSLPWRGKQFPIVVCKEAAASSNHTNTFAEVSCVDRKFLN